MLEKYTSQEILLQASGNQMICFAALSDFLSPLFLLCNNRLLTNVVWLHQDYEKREKVTLFMLGIKNIRIKSTLVKFSVRRL